MIVQHSNEPEARLFIALLNQVFMDLTSVDKNLIRDAKIYLKTKGFREVCDLLSIDSVRVRQKISEGKSRCILCGTSLQRKTADRKRIQFFCSSACKMAATKDSHRRHIYE